MVFLKTFCNLLKFPDFRATIATMRIPTMHRADAMMRGPLIGQNSGNDAFPDWLISRGYARGRGLGIV